MPHGLDFSQKQTPRNFEFAKLGCLIIDRLPGLMPTWKQET